MNSRGPALLLPPWSVAIVAALVTVAVLLLCFLVPRSPGMEEAGVFNAVYTYAYAGRMAFPVYGRDFFESFGIQPPPHFAILGSLLRHGLSLYTAEGVAIAASAVTAIVLIVRSILPTPVKLGFLLGLYGTIVLAVMYLPDDAIGVRPELNVTLIWFAGLVALQSGRLEGWRRRPLALGTMLVTLAATMQNYALLAPLGLIPYALKMIRTVPARETIRTIAWCFAAGCVVGIPFLLWHVFPNWQMMRGNVAWGTTHAPAAGAKIAAYFSIYDVSFVPRLRADLWSASFAAAPMFLGLLLRVPLIIPAFVLLFTQRSTRGMAVACLPVPVLITWIRPEAQYYISEHIVFLAAFWATAFRGLQAAAMKLAPHRRVLRDGVAAAVCCAAIVLGSPPLGAIRLSDGIPLHEFDIARASARQIVGTNALVASRHLAWYLSGGASWYRLESDITEPATLDGFEAKPFAAQFDAIADYGLFSAQTQNGTTPSSLYATGALELKGFYLAQRMTGLSFLVFQPQKQGALHGYVLRDDRLQRFDEDPAGSWVFVLLYGSATPAPFRRAPAGGAYSPNVLEVPGHPSVRALSALILPRQTYAQVLATLPAGFERREEVFGTLAAVDARALVEASRATDRPIRFLRTPQEDAVVDFVAGSGHPTAAGGCDTRGRRRAQPEVAVSFGHFGELTAGHAFDESAATMWASKTLGPRTRHVSHIGGDFGRLGPVAVTALTVQQSADPGSSISSAILMASTSGYDWQPVAALALKKGGEPQSYCLPAASGAYRFWTLLANDNPLPNHAWQVSSLAFYQ